MNPKYITSFSNLKIKSIVSEEKDKYLSLASFNELRKFIPNVDSEKNIDLLPIAFDACVVNRVNKNGDVIDTSTAKDILSNFINKPINVEHDRGNVIGVILNANFSKFGTSEKIDLEKEESLNQPFNITLGGVIWKIVNQNLASLIEESNDPSSDKYMTISASWELGFNEYELVLLENDNKNIENGQIISDAKQIEKYSPKLRANGGNGKIDNKFIYRKVIGNVIPLGVGLTLNPAADVQGVAIKNKEDLSLSNSDNAVADPDLLDIEPNTDIKEDEDIISQRGQNDVKHEGVINKIFMKIDNINQITDELLKQVAAASVTEFIAEEIKKASESFVVEKAEKDNAIKAAQEKYETLSNESTKVKEELEKIKAALSKLEEEKAIKEKEEAFNLRMASFDEEFDLSDEDRQVIATDVKDLNDETFAAYKNKMAVLMKEKNKAAKKAKMDKEDIKDKGIDESKEDKNGKIIKASTSFEVKASEQSATEVVEEVIQTSKLEKASIPNSSTTTEPTLKEKFSKAFSLEGFDIK